MRDAAGVFIVVGELVLNTQCRCDRPTGRRDVDAGVRSARTLVANAGIDNPTANPYQTAEGPGRKDLTHPGPACDGSLFGAHRYHRLPAQSRLATPA